MKASKRNPVDDVLAGFWNSRDSAGSKRMYIHDWQDYEAWCASNNVAILKAKPSDVQRYVLSLRDDPERKLAPATRARMLSVVRSCYDALVVNDLLPTNPAKSVKSPRGATTFEPNTPWLDEDGTRRLLASLAAGDDWRSRRDRLALLLFVGLGWRRAEVARMCVSDFRDGKVTGTVKGGKRVTVGVPSWLESEIDRWCKFAKLEADDALLPSREGSDESISPQALYLVVKEAASRADVEITPHGLRRTFITTLRGRGTDLKELQVAVAHSSSATTERYDRARQVSAPGEKLADLVYGLPAEKGKRRKG